MMTCEHEGCTAEGQPCYLTEDPPDRPSYFFCWRHAREEGFCPSCGSFWGGIESFDFSESVLCEVCAAELDKDEDEDDWGDVPG
jgi:predicted amidophosphoribosyltransferase